MALELRQQLKLAQKLVMTPQLRQAIKLLQLNRLELTDALQAEMEQNPLLEEAIEEPNQVTESDSPRHRRTAREPLNQSVTAKVPGDDPSTLAEINWADYANTFDTDLSFSRETPAADAPSQFDFISTQPGLTAHMQWQLTDLDLNDQEMDIAMFIIGNLDRHGFLQADHCRHLRLCRLQRGNSAEYSPGHTKLDPPGIAARDIRESLLLQLEPEGAGGFPGLPDRQRAHEPARNEKSCPHCHGKREQPSVR